MQKNRWLVVALLMLVCSGVVFAQSGLKLTISTGYSFTSFEEDTYSDAAGTLPLGLSIGKQFTPALEAGVELLYPLGGYTWELDFLDLFKINTTFNQMLTGVYGRYAFGSNPGLKPFAKAGVGLYSGNGTVEVDGESEDFDVKSAIGFNLGGGVYVKENLWVQFQYHIVKREAEDMDEKSGTNTWDITLGYVFHL